MKLNLNFQIKDLSGKEFSGEESNAGKILAECLCQMNKNNSIKLYDFALKLYNKQEIDVDQTDFDMLVSFIDSTQALPVITKAQLIKSMESQKA